MRFLRCSTVPVIAASLFLGAACSAWAQAYRAQVRGLVTDQTSAVLPGATVTLSNIKTGVSAVKQTD
ncbi:MAG TPA: carboxypeptidase-like regulatory domain-containing protein, partial [Bryobacteraceae bacterium]